jgi:hypothetical protein
MHSTRAAALAIACAAAPGSPLAAQNSAHFESWNIGYAVPSGWRQAQQIGRVHGLTSGSGAVIYVAPGMYRSFNDIAPDVAKGFQALGVSGVPAGQPASSTIKGMQAMTARYLAQNQMGMALQSEITAVLTPHGTGLVVTGIAPPQIANQMAAAVDQIAQSIRVRGAPETNQQAIAALRGRWTLYAGKAAGVTGATGGASRGYEESVEFDGAGRFAWQSSASVSVTAPGLTGSAGSANASSDQGSYTVIGSTLVVRGQQGQASFEIQVLADRIVADGKTYLRVN